MAAPENAPRVAAFPGRRDGLAGEDGKKSSGRNATQRDMIEENAT